MHFLGRFVFVVFPQVAVTTGDGNFLGIGRDLFLDQLSVFVLAFLQAFPGDDEGSVLLALFAGDEGLDGRITLDDPGQQGAFVHVIEAGGELQGAGQVLDDLEVG